MQNVKGEILIGKDWPVLSQATLENCKNACFYFKENWNILALNFGGFGADEKSTFWNSLLTDNFKE